MAVIIASSVVAGNNPAKHEAEDRSSNTTELFSDDEVVSETIRIVTAYNAGDPAQNQGDPCISANGENLCQALSEGKKRCAANFVPLGTKLYVDKYGIFVVTDRTNKRYRNRVDIAMKLDEIHKAKQFGKKRLNVKILKNRKDSSPAQSKRLAQNVYSPFP